MSALAADVLGRVLAGDETLLEGFGFVRLTTRGPLTRAGVSTWEDRVEVSGDGHARLTLHRSLSDMPGRQPGIYEVHKDRAFVLNLVSLLKAQPFHELPLSRIEPSDVMISMTVVAGGHTMEYALASHDQAAAAAVTALLNALIPLVGELEQHPVMSLGVTLVAPRQASVRDTRVNVSMVFGNSGSVGYWLTHPSRLGDEQDLCELQFGKLPEIRDDVMPEPFEVLRAALTPVDAGPVDLIWIAPHGQATVQLTGEIQYLEAGDYFMRCGYCSYNGSVTVASQPRFVGGAFSEDVQVNVT